MKLRLALPLLACLTAPALFAQEEINVTHEARPDADPEPLKDPNEPLMLVEQMPEFPGGQEAMFAYIGKELKYPKEAIDRGIEGAVFIQFVVERDGSIGEVKVLRGIGGGCDEEAVRVVQGMPKWSPGKQSGKEVRTRFNLPIRYKLQSKKEPKE